MNHSCTPGPWTTDIDKLGVFVVAGAHADPANPDDDGPNDGEPIAICKGPDAIGNAFLVAAAPDLLAACKAALSLLENWASGKLAKLPAGGTLRAAIAKAEGRTP